LTYDANGNLASADDFNAHRTCYASDLTRNLETTRVEGLPNTQACATVTPPNAVLPATSRKTSTQWHPDWRLAIKVAEPGKITTSVYHGQPDPFNANAIASCAPASALLPDGKPIAVLCRQVEQASTDADGHLGFTAALQAGVPNREQKWTYNAFGQVLTHDGPRTDISDITTYTYYPDTTADHTLGDLQRVTNALGQTTNFSKYNKHGQLLQSTDPNGVTTTHTYDLRQRLLSTSVAGQTTSYSYDPVGQLKKVTQPDASWIGYDYDAAHRLIALYDNQGNRISYTLDNAGNRIAENTKDPAGTLKRALSRSIDALGRVQQTTGRE
ncbi:MAG: RHS repeat protein, partial [Actinomycetota bacterium]